MRLPRISHNDVSLTYFSLQMPCSSIALSKSREAPTANESRESGHERHKREKEPFEIDGWDFQELTT